MRWFAGSDHAGLPLKRVLVELLRKLGDEVIDLGTHGEAAVDYPDFGASVGRAVASAGGQAMGLVVCGSGIGISIAANKVPGARAALCADAETARGARRFNDANVLALSLRTTSEALLTEILDGWFEEGPSSEHDDVANIRHVEEIR